MMHGHGYFKQNNGYKYEGLFENGLPAKMGTKLVIFSNGDSDEKQNLEIYEGQMFKVTTRVLNDDDLLFSGNLSIKKKYMNRVNIFQIIK